MSRRNHKVGITLLETLVALAIMGMVAAILTSGLGATIQTLDRSGFVSASAEEAVARRDLRIWLENALLSPVPNDERPVFEGKTDRLTFLSLPPGGTFWTGAAAAIEVGEAGSLVLASGLMPEPHEAFQTRTRIAPDDTRLSFQYWGIPKAGEGPAWHDHWLRELGLPELVKITFTGGARPLPPMTIRPGKEARQSEMSLSSLLPPALPSRP